MVELFLTACLLAQPVKCEAFFVPFHEPMGLYQCMRHGQILAVDWSREHPDWRVTGWRCAIPEA